jgi:hypothetical protein
LVSGDVGVDDGCAVEVILRAVLEKVQAVVLVVVIPAQGLVGEQ